MGKMYGSSASPTGTSPSVSANIPTPSTDSYFGTATPNYTKSSGDVNALKQENLYNYLRQMSNNDTTGASDNLMATLLAKR